MVIQPAPVCDAYEALCKKLGKRPRVIYMTPQGRVFNQSIAEELAKEENLVFLCGHYEGIDERALELIQAEYLSAGDFVLTGGELPSMVMIDCISRLVPGVLGNGDSAEVESFTTICWNILSTQDRRFMRESLCRKSFFPDIIKY